MDSWVGRPQPCHLLAAHPPEPFSRWLQEPLRVPEPPSPWHWGRERPAVLSPDSQTLRNIKQAVVLTWTHAISFGDSSLKRYTIT